APLYRLIDNNSAQQPYAFTRHKSIYGINNYGPGHSYNVSLRTNREPIKLGITLGMTLAEHIRQTKTPRPEGDIRVRFTAGADARLPSEAAPPPSTDRPQLPLTALEQAWLSPAQLAEYQRQTQGTPQAAALQSLYRATRAKVKSNLPDNKQADYE